jgi:hypothetical protein
MKDLIATARKLIEQAKPCLENECIEDHIYDPATITALCRLLLECHESLDELTNAALADLKPLPTQVDRAFKALAAAGKEAG